MSKQIKSEILRVRLSEHYRRKLKNYAAKHDVSESHVIREYVRRLPDVSKDFQSVEE